MSDVIYKTNSCPGCVFLENALAAKPIAGVRILNIDTDPQARKYFNLTRSTAVPTAVIDGQVVVGAHTILQALRAKYGAP
jgi:glutaredoxin